MTGLPPRKKIGTLASQIDAYQPPAATAAPIPPESTRSNQRPPTDRSPATSKPRSGSGGDRKKKTTVAISAAAAERLRAEARDRGLPQVAVLLQRVAQHAAERAPAPVEMGEFDPPTSLTRRTELPCIVTLTITVTNLRRLDELVSQHGYASRSALVEAVLE